MKFNSILKLSLHNLFNNKLRTILTIIVLLIMAIVVMVMAGFGISFYSSMDKNIAAVFQKDGTEFSVQNQELTKFNGYNQRQSVEIPVNDIKTILEKLDTEEGLFTYISLDSSRCNNVKYTRKNGGENWIEPVAYYAKSNMFYEKENYLESGRMWNKTDDGSKNIWLSADFLDEGYKIGDEMTFNFDTLSKFKVCGIISNSVNNRSSRMVYIDYSFFDDKVQRNNYGNDSPKSSSAPSLNICSIDAKLITQEDFSYGTTVINKLSKVSKEVSTYKKDIGGLEVRCGIIAETKMANYMLLGIVGVLIFLGAIIIMLSIGSVSNTIKITVEQNRKFFGMMKAIGMQDKTVRNVVQWQALILVIFSVVIASSIVLGLMVAMKSIISSLVTTLFGTTAIVVCSLNPAIPFITAFMLIAAVLLSTRKSLNKISKMDVISVISEVN